jgi:hypothetical protein
LSSFREAGGPAVVFHDDPNPQTAGWPILRSLTAKGGLFAQRANRFPQTPSLKAEGCVGRFPKSQINEQQAFKSDKA